MDHRAMRLAACIAIGVIVAGTASCYRAPSNRVFRIGYQNSPPHQFVMSDGSPYGPAIEVLTEAAKRAGIGIEWVYAPEGPESAIRSGSAELWPLMGDLPERHKFASISDPWIMLSFWLVSRDSKQVATAADLKGKLLSHGPTDIDRRLARQEFEGIPTLQMESTAQVYEAVCLGRSDAGLISGSFANTEELRSVEACRDRKLSFHMLPEGRIPFGVGASLDPGAKWAAGALRREIARMAADGSLSSLYLRWYLDPNNEAMAVFYLSEAQRVNRVLTAALAAMGGLLILLAWQTVRVRTARARAVQANAAKSAFLANMSHEIRTPMHAVIGMISMARERCTDAEAREHLGVAQEAAQSLTSVLNDILDLSKVDAGKLSIESICFPLRQLVEDTVRIHTVMAATKGLQLACEIAPEVPQYALGDPLRIRQILTNLLGNAIKFTDRGSVHLRLSCGEDDLVRFEISDTGIGIEPDRLRSVFEPFTQADNSHARRYGGSGLGLTITQRLVGLMGGTIQVESSPASGSRFWVELRLRKQPPPETLEPECSAAPAGGPLHVLVCEDNRINQKLIMALVSKQQWTAELAADGREALERFNATNFDLILMDVQMPGMDGLAAATAIRKEEERRGVPRTPIIAVTAHAMESDAEHCRAAGMDAIITKPVDLEHLCRVIHQICIPEQKKSRTAPSFS